MQEICSVREFSGDDADKALKELISDIEISEKKKILEYLKSFEPDCAAGMCLTDEITGKDLNLCVEGFEDDEYYWDTRYIYHFEKYNLQLNSDFISHVLAR